MVIFGGYGYDYFNDVWELHLETGSEYWEQLSISGPGPSARDGHAAVYDPAGNRMVVFGGRMSGYDYFNDTWVLDFDTMSWSQLAISGPPARANFEAIYDSSRQRMIIFGGESPGYIYRNDVWALDLTEGAEAWTEIVDSGAIPEGRSSLCLEYDSAAQRMILQGGQYYDGSFHHLDDLMALDLNTNVWDEIGFQGSRIEARRNSASALFRIGGMNYLFIHGGGRAGSDFYGDAWVAAFE
jgi:outer membrane protein assembly factor BamB